MIKKIKASSSEKIIFIFLILLGIITSGTYFVIKNKCLFVIIHSAIKCGMYELIVIER